MGANKTKRHTHKYHKIEIAGDMLWACALPDCTHYMPYHLNNMVPGRSSICWNCGEKFILDPTNMKDDRPTCNECRVTKQVPPTEFIAEKVG